MEKKLIESKKLKIQSQKGIIDRVLLFWKMGHSAHMAETFKRTKRSNVRWPWWCPTYTFNTNNIFL